MPPIEKLRVVAGQQQIVRIDREDTSSLDATGADAVLSAVRDAVEKHDHRCVIVLSDYAKGMLDEAVVQRVIAFARERSLPVVVDPKSADIRKYSGATVVKPNFAEAALMAGVSATAPTEEVLAQIAEAMAVPDVSGRRDLPVRAGRRGRRGRRAHAASHARPSRRRRLRCR